VSYQPWRLLDEPPTYAKRRGEGYGIKGSKHVVRWPAANTMGLGVLLGMLYGDGHLYPGDYAARNGKWRIDFCEGDHKVLRKYATLTEKIFNIEPSVRVRGNWSEIYYCSRIVYDYYTLVGGHPTGKKTGKLSIPEAARRSRPLLNGFICGLFSVEGSVKANRYVRLTLEMLEPKLIQQLCRHFLSLEIKPHFYEYKKDGKMMQGMYIYGPKDTAYFLREFGLVGRQRAKLVKFLTSIKPTSKSPE
jgi:hypothetical protein